MYISVAVNKTRLAGLLIVYLLVILIFMAIGGKIASIASFIYAGLLIMGAIGTVYRFINMKALGMSLGIDNVTKEMSVKAYDNYITDYESRQATFVYWITLSFTLLMFYIFLRNGFLVVAGIQAAGLIISEIEKYTLYCKVKKNKTMYGAAMYVHAMREAIGNAITDVSKDTPKEE